MGTSILNGSETPTSQPDSAQETEDAAALDAFAKAYGQATPELAMIEACAQLRREAGELVPPIGLRRLLTACNAQKAERPISTAGRLEVDPHGFTIVVQRGINWRRQRFTIAHEIGHIILIEALRGNSCHLHALQAPTLWSRVERLCNLAAAEILIPMADLAQSLKRLLVSGDCFQMLYDRYLTSYTPLLLRFIDGGAAGIVLWTNYARHSNEITALRAVYSYRAPKSPWIPNGITASKHVFPDLVSAAVSTRTVVSGDLQLMIGHRANHMWSICLPFASAESTLPRQLPLFDGFNVPDERPKPWDVVSILFSRTPATEVGRLWEALERSH